MTIICIFLAIFLLNIINANDEQLFIVEENMQQDECSEGYTEASSFIDGGGIIQKLCIRKSELLDKMSYVTASYIEGGKINCTIGEITGRFSGKIEGGLQDVILCVEKFKNENSENFLTDVSIEEDCPKWFRESGSFVDNEDNLIFHCIKDKSETIPKIIIWISSAVILMIIIIVIKFLYNRQR